MARANPTATRKSALIRWLASCSTPWRFTVTGATVIRRRAGRSATAAASYRAGIRIEDERTGEIHDYTRKPGIYGSEILASDNVPEWVHDRAALWNEVERVEKRKDPQLAREINVALPNPHAHILLTMREIDRKDFGKKNRSWNERGLLRRQRESWSQYANEALERAGHEAQINHRNLENQGVKRLPQIHLGPQVIEMKMRGIRTAIGDEMRRRSQINRQIKRWQQENEKLDTQIAQQRAQIEAQPTAIRFESDHQKIESPKQETEPTLETLSINPTVSTAASPIRRTGH